jgi:mRNA interferase RelE/StbE
MIKSYHVNYTKKADRFLSKLDSFERKLILSWIGKNLEGCNDPRAHGKGLSGDRSGEWHYRIGDYRIIAEIQDNEVIILVVAIGHRRDAYDKQ